MTTLYCSYSTETWCNREPDPDDPWDNGDYGGDYIVMGVYLTGGMRDAYDTPEEIMVGDTVYVVYVAYDSGSSFGTDGGYGQIVAITKDCEAAETVENWVNGQVNMGRKYIDHPWPTVLPKPPYMSFLGYFEHNQRVRLSSFVVR